MAPQVSIDGPKATIKSLGGLKTVSITVNAHNHQVVTIRTAGREVYQFQGSGEKNSLGRTELPSHVEDIEVTCEYEEHAGVRSACMLRSSGVHNVGNLYFLILGAEDGHDNDFNDVIIQFSGVHH